MSLRTIVGKQIDWIASRLIDPQDAIVVTGFWRSGTTWVQQLISEKIRAKPVFEPLHWSVEEYADLVRQTLPIPRSDRAYLKSFMPHVDLDSGKGNALRKYLHRAMTGGLIDDWTRRGRGGIGEAFRTDIVVKFVRGHLLIPSLKNQFSPTLIHIRRDPRAVIASLFRNDWAWWMRELSLTDQLLRPNDGRQEFFLSHADIISGFDEEDFVTRAVAYWALTERFVDESRSGTGVQVIHYEELCLQGESYLDHSTDTGESSSVNVRSDSPTTTQSRKGASIEERLYGWKEELASTTIDKINRTLQEVGAVKLLSRST
jgi:hypothetical protein